MIPFFKTLNLLQTVLFLIALLWFIVQIPGLSGDAVLLMIALLIIWLTIIAVLGKLLFDAQRNKEKEGPARHLSVYEFIRQLQKEPKRGT